MIFSYVTELNLPFLDLAVYHDKNCRKSGIGSMLKLSWNIGKSSKKLKALACNILILQ